MRKKELWQKVEKAATERGVKQYKYLYRRMLDENIIRKAYKKLRKGKTKRIEIQKIDADLDNEVTAMRRMIENTKPPDIPVEHPKLAYRPKRRTPKLIKEKGKNGSKQGSCANDESDIGCLRNSQSCILCKEIE